MDTVPGAARPAAPTQSEVSRMELDLSNEQELLRQTAARFIEATCPLSVVRRLIGDETGLPADYLEAAGRLGWFSLLVPEEDGGADASGTGLCDLAIVAEERGRVLQPGPFASMNVAAAALADAGSATQRAEILPAICEGVSLATWASGDRATGSVPDATLTATTCAGGFVVSGRTGPVPAATEAEWLLVSADGPEGPSQFILESATPGITATPLAGLDVTQRFGRLSFDQVVVAPTSLLGAFGGAGRDLERELRVACVLSTSETVGAMDALFDLTRRYAVDRTAFGRPIGSFQAVKHQLADMSLSLETSKAVAAAALRAVQEDHDDAGEILSMAKSWVSDAGIDLVQGCAQVFAGIGFTWEHDLHLFLRRITMNGLLFGSSEWHRERICGIHAAEMR